MRSTISYYASFIIDWLYHRHHNIIIILSMVCHCCCCCCRWHILVSMCCVVLIQFPIELERWIDQSILKWRWLQNEGGHNIRRNGVNETIFIIYTQYLLSYWCIYFFFESVFTICFSVRLFFVFLSSSVPYIRLSLSIYKMVVIACKKNEVPFVAFF